MTRGRKKEVKSITLTGNIFLKYEYEEEQTFETGDIMFVLNNDATSPFKGEYYKIGYAGYFKLYVYDGYDWKHLIDNEFFENRENHFSKKEMPIDNFEFIKDTVTCKAGVLVYKTYREHYTTYLHEMNAFKGKKGHFKKDK
ncbi:MAG: hypothetical protein J0G32_06810 [Alphaproteobacteria bacterium]|nr:hypothetical protein [Alphaproteobacteria bacterium]OJV15809.1 MAG: hypothetical protein BGO27_07845 [Alphaproteobacteria bacterium 33-17]